MGPTRTRETGSGPADPGPVRHCLRLKGLRLKGLRLKVYV